jgi:putative transposase
MISTCQTPKVSDTIELTFFDDQTNTTMKFSEGNIYHIYNRGINRRPIFFKRDNYLFFMQKMQDLVCKHADLLAWVLMPNHFHFVVYANEDTCRFLRLLPLPISRGSEDIRLLLSSYAKAIQKQEKLTGNIFQQKTKSKLVTEKNYDYSSAAFHYLHQNPYRAGLVEKLGDWEFSSIHEYAEPGNSRYATSTPKLCNTKLARLLLDFGPMDIVNQTYRVIPSLALENIFQKHRSEEKMSA